MHKDVSWRLGEAASSQGVLSGRRLTPCSWPAYPRLRLLLSEDKGARVLSIMERECNKAAEESAERATKISARETSEAIARKMYANGMELATISQYIDLSIGDLEKLLLPKAS